MGTCHRRSAIKARILLSVPFLFILAKAFAAPVITPSTPTVVAGNQVQLSADSAVTWSMMPGSVGSVDSTGKYTAPSSFGCKNAYAGVCLLPNDHVYETDITSLPVDSNSTSRTTNVGASALHFEVAMPLNIFDVTTTSASMKFFYTTASDGRYFPVGDTPYRGVENSLYPADYFAQDRHQLGVNKDNSQVTEIYNYYPVGQGTSEGCPTCNAQSGVQYGPMSYDLADAGPAGGSIDAAGMYITPLLIRNDEMQAGVINHAIRFTLANGYITNTFVWPGTNSAGSCSNTTNCFPFGARLRLKQSFNISGFSAKAQIILRALKKYGMFLADNGQTMYSQVAYDVGSDSNTWNVFLNELRFNSSPVMTDFEQVDESSIQFSTSTGKVLITNGKQVVPDNYAVVIATKTSDSTATYTYIGIQPVTAGFKNPAFPVNGSGISVMSGTPQITIPYWVNGSTTATATCSMSPTIGSITSGCKYTAPTSGIVTSSVTYVTVTPTNVTFSTGAITFPITIFSSDAIRVDIGGKASSIASPVIPYDGQGNYGKDTGGNFWAQDPYGSVPGWYGKDDNSSPQSSWPASTDVGLYYTQRHGTSDAYWSAMVPNGTYSLTLKFASSDQNQVNLSSVSIDTQGTVVFSTTSAVYPGFHTFTPENKTYTVSVTNNQFYFAIREVYNNRFPALSSWKLNLNSLAGSTSCVFKGNSKFKGSLKAK